MKAYLDLLKEVIETGRSRGDRTGTGTVSIFDAKLKYDLSKGEFPLLTTRFIPRKAVWLEYIAILNGELHLETLTENGVTFWDPWRLSDDITKEVELLGYERIEWLKKNDAVGHDIWHCNSRRFNTDEAEGHRWLDERGVPRTRTALKNKTGDLNAPYGPGWRNFSDDPLRKQGVDQVELALKLLRHNPESRRILISAWNPLWTPEETKEVKLTNEEMWAHLKENDPNLYTIFWDRLSDLSTTDNSEAFLASHGVPTHKTVKVSPQDNIVEGKPCLTPCFLPGSVVLTPMGYSPIEELKKGDLVITGEGNHQEINRRWVTPHKGDYFSIKVAYQKPTIDCTGNHPFLVKDRGYVNAEDLNVGDMLAILKPKVDDKPFTYKFVQGHGTHLVPKSRTFTENDYYTFGYFVGNGWISDFGKRISIAVPNSKKDDILPKLRETIKLNEKPNSGLNVRTYQTFSVTMWPLFQTFGRGALNKTIPEWVLNSPIEFLDAFLAGYTDADGCEGKNGSTVFTTVSKSLAYGLQRLYSRKGVVARIYHQKRPKTTIIEGRIVNQNDTFLIEVPKTKNLNRVIHEDDYVWVPIEGIEKGYYEGPVYNLDVGTDHTYVVQNIVNHNCHWAVEFYVEEMSTQERLDWCSANANPYFQDIWEDHMSDVYSEEHCGQEKMSPERKAEWLTENKVPTQWLSLKWHQRSVDYMVGEPFNQVFYAYMLLSFAHELGMAAHTLVGDLTNVHVYRDHIDAAKLQLAREPMKPIECFIRDESLYNSSVKKKGLFELGFDDFVFTKYEHHPAIELKPSV